MCRDPSKIVYDTTNGTNPSCESSYLFFCAYHDIGIICDGKNSSDQYVCSGHGICVNDDDCICEPRYWGKYCQFFTYDEELEFENIMLVFVFISLFCGCGCCIFGLCSIICIIPIAIRCYLYGKKVEKENIELRDGQINTYVSLK